MKKKIGILFLALICIYGVLKGIDHAYAYEKIKEDGYLIGVIDSMCLICDTNEEYYAMLYEEGSLEINEEKVILVSVNIKNELAPTSFSLDDRIYVEFDEYKISRNRKEIIIDKPTLINTEILEEKGDK